MKRDDEFTRSIAENNRALAEMAASTGRLQNEMKAMTANMPMPTGAAVVVQPAGMPLPPPRY